MAKSRPSTSRQLDFRNKLVLNQWLISLFGVDPLREHRVAGRPVRPIHVLSEPIRDPILEGLDEANIHRFYRALVQGTLFPNENAKLTDQQLLAYEENIVRHTQHINQKRHRPITWKYHQWLTLLFTEIYLDRYFNDRAGLLAELNAHEGPASKKILFHEKIKEVEQRLGDPNVILNSFILSWTPHPRLEWGLTREELEKQHVLFMSEDKAQYVEKLIKATV